MGISEREHHIKVLENLLSHYKAREKCEGYYDSALKDNVDALQYALSSLKTDLKYDLMYEGEEIYTKADLVAMLKEIQTEIEGQCKKGNSNIRVYDYNNGISACYKVIQSKIDKLKEGGIKNGNK